MCAKDTFAKMDHILFGNLWHCARFRHPHKPRRWTVARYWRVQAARRWNFADRKGRCLLNYEQTSIRRHVKVRGTSSPFDGHWIYWTSRLGHHPEVPARVSTLLRWQHGKCAECGLYLRDGDVLEVDHILPLSLGGMDWTSNPQLLHRHCHDQKTAGDGSVKASLTVRGADDNGQPIEELDARKRARPVLQTSQAGEGLA